MTTYELIIKINLLEIQLKHLKEEILEKRLIDIEQKLSNIKKNMVYNKNTHADCSWVQ